MALKILFDHCTPRPLRRALPAHDIKTTYQMGWAEVVNGDLLTLAEQQFDVFLTTDQSLPNQQNMRGHAIAVIVLVAVNNKPETLFPLMPQVEALLPTVQPGQLFLISAEDSAQP